MGGVSLEDFARAIPGLAGEKDTDKILLFGWYLHKHKDQAHFQPTDIRVIYDALHLVAPALPLWNAYFQQLVNHRVLIQDSFGHRLERSARDSLEAKYGNRDVTVQVAELLVSLPEKIPGLAERTYLEEALICFRYGAFRAAVVMTWNLTYHHLCDHILRSHLAEFNARWLVRYPADHKSGQKVITTMDDFGEELKESKVIGICSSAGIITHDVRKILDEKLGRRNSAAHPSSVDIGQLQAEAFIDDLIKNVVLKLA